MPKSSVDVNAAIRPPQQRRSREAWNRVLDAGVELLEEGGAAAFTIAAICERAAVAPRAVYARAQDKDALLLAVYEHGMARVRAEEDLLFGDPELRELPGPELARRAVAELAGIFRRHAPFLRATILASATHPEIHRRGQRNTRQLGDRFGELLAGAGDDTAVATAFNAVFAALVLRVGWGPGFAAPPVDDEQFLDALSTMVARYLF